MAKKPDPIVEQGTAVLPPAGYERDEVLKIRDELLTQEAEERSEREEVYALDPKAFKVENEIAQHFDALQVTSRQDGYIYNWANFMTRGGMYVQYKLAVTVNGQPLWEVVKGDMPECSGQRAADGTRRIGDVMLLRAKKERYEIWWKNELVKRLRRKEGVTADLQELGEKYRSLGVIVKVGDEIGESTLRRMQNRASAQAIGARMQDKWLREGRMPGVRAPQK